ncbi:unnamed protein product [Moneuplotes crassus]|uniref:Uncharacterized protein n=1 Tax=Euplotes crassus TaxID=5936 RepID=A0AAD2CWQ4_EUPCR|nr:unnamed protein product [Moneuplotes crassus]
MIFFESVDILNDTESIDLQYFRKNTVLEAQSSNLRSKEPIWVKILTFLHRKATLQLRLSSILLMRLLENTKRLKLIQKSEEMTFSTQTKLRLVYPSLRVLTMLFKCAISGSITPIDDRTCQIPSL